MYLTNAAKSKHKKAKTLDGVRQTDGRDRQADSQTDGVHQLPVENYSRLATESPQCHQYSENVYSEFRVGDVTSDEEVEEEELAVWHAGPGSKVSL